MCTKRAFTSLPDAEHALAQCHGITLPKADAPRRAYRCPDCEHWHLTSHAKPLTWLPALAVTAKPRPALSALDVLPDTEGWYESW